MLSRTFDIAFQQDFKKKHLCNNQVDKKVHY